MRLAPRWARTERLLRDACAACALAVHLPGGLRYCLRIRLHGAAATLAKQARVTPLACTTNADAFSPLYFVMPSPPRRCTPWLPSILLLLPAPLPACWRRWRTSLRCGTRATAFRTAPASLQGLRKRAFLARLGCLSTIPRRYAPAPYFHYRCRDVLPSLACAELAHLPYIFRNMDGRADLIAAGNV